MKKLILLLLLPVFIFSINCTELEDVYDKYIELPVVMYHHLSPKSKLWGDYVLSVEQFEKDLIYLKNNGYTTVTATQLIAWSDGQGELPEKPVMITFDDGYESTVVYALPLLEKYGMTAVVFPIGAATQQFTDLPDHMLDYSHMSWESVAQLKTSTVLEVQCHTYDMHKLSPRKGCNKKSGEVFSEYREAFRSDIEKFQELLESYIGHTSNALALPFGCYSEETIKIAGEMGFYVVFTCVEKVNSLTGNPAELMELGRYNRASGKSSEDFFARWDMD